MYITGLSFEVFPSIMLLNTHKHACRSRGLYPNNKSMLSWLAKRISSMSGTEGKLCGVTDKTFCWKLALMNDSVFPVLLIHLISSVYQLGSCITSHIASRMYCSENELLDLLWCTHTHTHREREGFELDYSGHRTGSAGDIINQ